MNNKKINTSSALNDKYSFKDKQLFDTILDSTISPNSKEDYMNDLISKLKNENYIVIQRPLKDTSNKQILNDIKNDFQDSGNNIESNYPCTKYGFKGSLPLPDNINFYIDNSIDGSIDKPINEPDNNFENDSIGESLCDIKSNNTDTSEVKSNILTNNTQSKSNASLLDSLKDLSKDELINLFINSVFKYDELNTRVLWINFINRYLSTFINIYEELKIVDEQIDSKYGLGKIINQLQIAKDNNIDNLINDFPEDLEKCIDSLIPTANCLHNLYNKIITLKKNLDNDETYQAYLNNDLFSTNRLLIKFYELQGSQTFQK